MCFDCFEIMEEEGGMSSNMYSAILQSPLLPSYRGVLQVVGLSHALSCLQLVRSSEGGCELLLRCLLTLCGIRPACMEKCGLSGKARGT
jgi:hypothetical protein